MARLTREMRTPVMLLPSSFDMALHSPNASRSREMHGVGQSEEGLPRLRNLLICIGMANRKTVLQIKLPACRCQQDGRLPVSWHAENGDRDGNISEEASTKWLPRLCRTTRDSELLHSQLERGSFHCKMCRCAVRAGNNPIAFLESPKNLLAFRFLQNAVKCAICRFGSSGFFRWKVGLGELQIANVDV